MELDSQSAGIDDQTDLAIAGARKGALSPGAATSVDLPWRGTTIALALILGIGSVVLVALHERPEWGFHQFEFRIAIDTAAGIGALTAAMLMSVRYTQTRSLAAWLLMAGVGCYALTALFTFLLPGIFPDHGVETAGAPLLGRLLASVLLAAATFADIRPMRRPPSLAASAELVTGAAAACAIAGIAAARLAPDVVVGTAGAPTGNIEGVSALYCGITATSVALLLFCGVALWLRSGPLGDNTIGWLAIGAALVGVGRLDALLTASASASLVSAGDLMRLAGTGAFVVAAAAEFRRFEQRLTDAVTADERRRLARDLHDGLAQDLAFIVSQASAMARGPGNERMRHVAHAAERAMADSRRAIHLLNRPRSRALSAALAERCYELCSRADLQLDFAMLSGEVHATPEVEHAVMQIVSEAVNNAAKHAQASTVAVELYSTGDSFRVCIRDNGRGFDPEARPARRRLGGVGLTSMAERARAVGGDLRINSDHEAGGTTVEVAFE